MEIMLRAQASELGLTHYFTGQPCINGHISKRRVKDRCCLKCDVSPVSYTHLTLPTIYSV